MYCRVCVTGRKEIVHGLQKQSATSSANEGLSNVDIDQAIMVQPGPEVFKRKQDDAQLSKRTDRNTHQAKETVVSHVMNDPTEVAEQPHLVP